ncbi:hypothetical protein [Breoghania sp.]|uniref:hypothetical protein n=1 Tax=Breoghania sp. TaxID=2065378 RepID=UPI002AA7A577|nr:hypothetical protein [Breoghania sp.]
MITGPGRMQATYTSGELDPLLIDRTSLKYFGSGAKHMENVQVHPQGGFSLRAGTRDAGGLPADAQRMAVFNASNGASYDLIFAPGILEIWGEAGKVTSIEIPYGADELSLTNFAQQLDTLLIFHGDVQTRRLKRFLVSGEWELDLLPWENIPSYDYGGDYDNAVAAVWELELVGVSADSVFQLTISGDETRSMTYVDLATAAADIKTAILELPTVVEGISVEESGSNKIVITFSGKGNEGDGWAVSGTVINKSDAAIVSYKTTVGVAPGEAVISDERGWPRCGAFVQQRLLPGGLKSLPNNWLASMTGNYWNFDDRLDEANGSFQVPMDVPGGEAVERIVAGRNVLIFTTEGEYWLSDRAISKTTAPVHVKSSSHGCKPGVPIVENEGAAIFVHGSGGVISEFRYTDVDGNFVALPISILASHMFSDICDQALRRARLSTDANVLAVVEAEGDMRLGHLLREQDVTAFTRTTTAGDFKAVICNGRNELTSIVERAGAGGVRRRLERFEPGLLLDDAVDVVLDEPDTVISGLELHEGQEVWALADGDVFGPCTVEGGAIEVPRAVSTATVGRWTPPKVETLPPPREVGPGIVVKRKARIHSVWLSLIDTTSVAISSNGGKVYDIDLQHFGIPADVAELDMGFTGVIALRGFTGYADEPTVTITQTRPGRLTVRSITIEADL